MKKKKMKKNPVLNLTNTTKCRILNNMTISGIKYTINGNFTYSFNIPVLPIIVILHIQGNLNNLKLLNY